GVRATRGSASRGAAVTPGASRQALQRLTHRAEPPRFVSREVVTPTIPAPVADARRGSSPLASEGRADRITHLAIPLYPFISAARRRHRHLLRRPPRVRRPLAERRARPPHRPARRERRR